MMQGIADFWNSLRAKCHRRSIAPLGIVLSLYAAATSHSIVWEIVGSIGVLIFVAAWAGEPNVSNSDE